LFPHLNFALYHINKPKNSIYSNENNLRMPIKTLISFDIPIALSSQIVISPSAMIVRQRKSQEIDLGADCSFLLSENSGKIENVFVGAQYRNAKSEGFSSLVLMGGIKYSKVTFTFSYDEYFNSFNYASLLGKSIEISIIYNGLNSITDKFSIPCDVY